jgi:hypothetical protein
VSHGPNLQCDTLSKSAHDSLAYCSGARILDPQILNRDDPGGDMNVENLTMYARNPRTSRKTPRDWREILIHSWR